MDRSYVHLTFSCPMTEFKNYEFSLPLLTGIVVMEDMVKDAILLSPAIVTYLGLGWVEAKILQWSTNVEYSKVLVHKMEEPGGDVKYSFTKTMNSNFKNFSKMFDGILNSGNCNQHGKANKKSYDVWFPYYSHKLPLTKSIEVFEYSPVGFDNSRSNDVPKPNSFIITP